MATVAHCLYCFEVLAADLEKREPISLARVQEWWTRYNKDAARGTPPQVEDGSRKENTVMTDNVDNDDDDDDDGDDKDDDDDEIAVEEVDSDVEDPIEAPVPRSDLLLPSISRLQNNVSPATGSSSGSGTGSGSGSSSSTPSSLSTTSSRAALGESSKSSSISSFFSFSHRSQASPARKEEEHPLFVTWNTVSSRGYKSLRGCIGTFDPLELSAGLKSYALTAALDDTRFAPIHPAELSTLSTAVTLLTAFTPATDPLDWTLGVHGLRISFSHHGKRHGATYLPNVALEQGWSKEETVVSLMRKAGWAGRSADWSKVADLRVVRYQGRKEEVAYGVWREWRDWVEKVEGVGAAGGGRGGGGERGGW